MRTKRRPMITRRQRRLHHLLKMYHKGKTILRTRVSRQTRKLQRSHQPRTRIHHGRHEVLRRHRLKASRIRVVKNIRDKGSRHTRLLGHARILTLSRFIRGAHNSNPLINIRPIRGHLLQFRIIMRPTLKRSRIIRSILSKHLLMTLFDRRPTNKVRSSSFNISKVCVIHRTSNLPFIRIPIGRASHQSIYRVVRRIAPTVQLGVHNGTKQEEPMEHQIRIRCGPLDLLDVTGAT